MENMANTIDLKFLSCETQVFNYSIMIIMDLPLYPLQLRYLKEKTDFIICTDSVTEELYQIQKTHK